jgi:antitoxin MazE
MKLSVVQIGNSKGIRIPKTILNQCDIQNEVDLEIEDGNIVLYPVNKKPRKDWDKKFKEMKKNGDDKLIIDANIDLEMDNWTW